MKHCSTVNSSVLFSLLSPVVIIILYCLLKENTLFISSTLNYFGNDSLLSIVLFPACDFVSLPLVSSNSTSDVWTNFSIGSTKSGLRWRTLKPFQRRMSSWGQQKTQNQIWTLFIHKHIDHSCYCVTGHARLNLLNS